jgi:hypothetical protein
MNAVRRNLSHTLPLFAAICVLLPALAACGSGSGDQSSTPDEEHALVEAAPESPPKTETKGEAPAQVGDLSGNERAAVEAAVHRYIGALDHHDGAAACALFEPGALDLGELPVQGPGCAASLEASIGAKPKGGAPAWRRTVIRSLTDVSVGPKRARVTATVTHDFSDRNYVSLEEDVIYLDRVGGRWLLAKPSGSFYRAVGYPEPPIRALTPP